jgi:AraC family transcriptional activator of pobA
MAIKKLRYLSFLKKELKIPIYQLQDGFFHTSPIENLRNERMENNHRHNFFEVIWFTSGVGNHYIDFQPYPVRKDLIYFLTPGQVHSLPEKTTGHLLIFSPDFFHNLQEDKIKFLFNPFIKEAIEIPPSLVARLDQLIQLMSIEYQEERDYLILQSHVKAFLLLLSRQSEKKPLFLKLGDSRMKTLFDLIEHNFITNRDAGFYASQLGITPKRLNEILKDKIGITLTKILHFRLILEAKREIGYSDKNFKEIAFALGFNEQAYFSRFFKKQTGITPEAFKQKTFKLSK